MGRDLSTAFDEVIASRDDDQFPVTFPARGTSFIDGFDSLLDKLSVGDSIWLRPEPDNEHDPNAVLLVDGRGKSLGHLPAEMAAVMPRDDWNWYARVYTIYRADAEKDLNAGLNLSLHRYDMTLPRTDSEIHKVNSDLIGRGTCSRFIAHVRENIGVPSSDKATDPLSAARLSAAIRIFLQEGVEPILLFDNENNRSVADLEFNEMIPIRLNLSQNGASAIVSDPLPLWWFTRDGSPSLAQKIYVETALSRFDEVVVESKE